MTAAGISSENVDNQNKRQQATSIIKARKTKARKTAGSQSIISIGIPNTTELQIPRNANSQAQPAPAQRIQTRRMTMMASDVNIDNALQKVILPPKKKRQIRQKKDQ